ncbi:zinc finger domain-containing protein, partial [Entomortierella chlamydospora]
NPINNNLCSKCFKELSQKNGTLQVENNTAAVSSAATTTTTPSEKSTTATTLVVPAPSSSSAIPIASPAPSTPAFSAPVAAQASTPAPDSGASTPTSIASDAQEGLAPGERPPQVNKGRCYLCRAKIPLAKQAINKCRCEFVFCDTHKATTKHDCDFDFAKMGKDLLTKNNPKLNDKPRGGRSFTRIQE